MLGYTSLAPQKQLHVASSKLQGPRRLMPRTFSLALLAVLLSSALASAQFRTVTVQNANNNPVPTTIQNTPTVNVSGTVPVSGGVAITNTPSGTAGAANTTGVVIKDLDEPARQPFQTRLLCSTTAAGSIYCQASYTVPAGKELVIEYVQVSSTENE